MKGIKKLLTGILAATMIMGASITAFAEETATVTIVRDSSYADQKKDAIAQTYTYYKVLSAKINTQVQPETTGEQKGVEALYYANSEAQKNALASLFEFASGVQENNETHYYVTGVKNTDMDEQEFAAAIASVVDANKTLFPGTTEDVSTADGVVNTTIDIPADGYYLVKSALGTKYILETWGKTSITVKEKNQYPNIDKTQMDGVTTTSYQDGDINVKVGDTIQYSVVVYVPATTSKNIIVTDTMSVGLTPANVNSITASVYNQDPKNNDGKIAPGDGTALTYDTDWTRAAGTEGATYAMSIKPTSATLGKFVQFKFTATVNANALTQDADKKNDVTLQYGNYYQYDTVKHHIVKTGLIKYDGATADIDSTTKELTAKAGKVIKYLEGAEFKLYAGNTEIPVVAVGEGANKYYRPAVTGETGVAIASVNSENPVVIRGLDGDVDYTLKETKAPTNYNPLSDSQNNFTLVPEDDDAINGTNTVSNPSICYIANYQGAILPSTGGIGTTIFYIVGGILIIAGVAYFIVRRKANSN